MTVKFILSEFDLQVLKRALKAYPHHKQITNCLLEIIEAQSEKQSD